MSIFQYKLDQFEGPLDLLLHMVGQRKVSIHDVPIAALIEQYLELMTELRDAKLEVQAEFLEMAARLVFIKSKALLPKHGDEEDAAEALRQELLDYRDCQLLAEQLRKRGTGFALLARPAEEIPPNYTYCHTHKPNDIFQAYLAAAGRGKRRLPPPVEAFSGIIAHRIVSVVSRFGYVFDRLRVQKRTAMRDMLAESESRSELVATFLAVLALCKANRITAHGSGSATVLALQPNEQEWRDIDDDE
ncbi:MAG: segregation/condensation protein A [Oscillospiraceae bacterium]|nr:segregation/condensation protein A [Oscillospiraceae bacterium]